MNLTDPAFSALLATLATSTDEKEAACSDNHLFEERVSVARQTEYERMVAAPADMGEWRSLHDKKYLFKHVKVTGDQAIPDSFLSTNDSALCQGFASNQDIVRVESLEHALNNSSLLASVETLQNWMKDNPASLKKFVEDWNDARLNWPMFGASYTNVKNEADADDWPHLLRDRLGLGYEGSTAAPIPVALMRYPAKLVLDKAKKDNRVAAGFALPTALDGDLNPYYFPAPTGRPYGATLNLAATFDDRLTAEILNLRIDYKPEHVWKVGYIRRPLSFGPLRKRRDQHLQLLRSKTQSSDFGRLMEGR